MTTTAVPVTTTAYADCGAGPLTGRVKALTNTAWAGGAVQYYLYDGPTTPADDTLSNIYSTTEGDINYGGTDKIFVKAIGVGFTLNVMR